MSVEFIWQDWYNGGLGSWWWGQQVLGPVVLKHWKDGVVIQSWANLGPSRGPGPGLYHTSGPAGGDYPNDNYSFARFNFYPKVMDPSQWTTPLFRMYSGPCDGCTANDDLPGGTGSGPNRREASFDPLEFSFKFYNQYGSDIGFRKRYQVVMFKKYKRTYLLAN